MIKNYTFKSIEDATEEVKRQVAMNKALKQILLGIGGLALILLFLVLTGCSATPEYTEQEIQQIQEDASSETAILVLLGDEVTVDGVTYSAGMITNTTPDGVVVRDTYYYFALNRINNHVMLCYDTGTSNPSHAMIDTGLVYNGPVSINGVEIPALSQQ